MSGEHVVWKYLFPEGSSSLEVEVPALARVVLFASQGPTLAVWIERPRADVRMQTRYFRVVGTGETFASGWAHRGSAMNDGGLYVFHLYERAAA